MMKKLLLIPLLVLLCAKSSRATIGFVQCAGGGHTASTADVVLSISPAAGNLLVAFVTHGSAATVTMTDSNSVAFTLQADVTYSSYTYHTTNGYEKNIASGITSVTFHPSASAYVIAVVCEYSGLSPTTPVDAVDSTGVKVTTGTVWNTSTMTPTASKQEVVIGFMTSVSGGGTFSCLAPASNTRFSTQITSFGIRWCDGIVASTSGSYQPNGVQPSGFTSIAIGATYMADPTIPNVLRHSVVLF